MAEHNTSPPNDGSDTSKPKKRAPRKPPLSLHPLTVDDALAISLGAGPLPEKAEKRAQKGTKKRAKQHGTSVTGTDEATGQ